MALTIVAVLLSVLAGCGSDAGIPDEADLAYVGPYELDLMAELDPDTEIIATLEHGEPVHITGHRRRFTEVITDTGLEGWVDGWMLLTPDEMTRLRQLSELAARLPSEGAATVYEPWNVHTAARRQSPAFFQITPGLMVDVLSRRIEPRAAYEPPATPELIFPQPSYRQPLDQPDYSGGADSWALVRLPDGRAGWALSQALVMAIPDEVAQYSEGDQITSYFSLGQVTDGGVRKNHWLWTTLSSSLSPYDFDGFRVFVWSTARHRYETAYRERNLTGYYPIQVFDSDGASPAAGSPDFSIVVRGEDGRLSRRAYAFSGYRVNLVSEGPWQPPLEQPIPAAQPLASDESDGGILDSIRSTISGWFR